MSNKTKSRLYRIWNNMKQRCNNPNNTVYHRYGQRGIDVCDEWKNSFDAFSEWAYNNGYNDSMTIDRIDNDGNYCPENCCIASWKDQANNRSDNHIISFNGKTQTLAQWSDELGVDARTLWARLKKWPVERALTEHTHSEFRRKLLTYNGETHSVYDWARICNIKPTTLSTRINRFGWSVEKALTTPVTRRA